MADLSELIEEIGNENVSVQPLHACMNEVNQKKGYTEVSFGTDTSVHDIVNNKKTALIVWCNSDDYDKALSKFKND